MLGKTTLYKTLQFLGMAQWNVHSDETLKEIRRTIEEIEIELRRRADGDSQWIIDATRHAYESGGLLAAVRIYRSLVGKSLSESKHSVEDMAMKYGWRRGPRN